MCDISYGIFFLCVMCQIKEPHMASFSATGLKKHEKISLEKPLASNTLQSATIDCGVQLVLEALHICTYRPPQEDRFYLLGCMSLQVNAKWTGGQVHEEQGLE